MIREAVSPSDAEVELQQGERDLRRRRQPSGNQARLGESREDLLGRCRETMAHLGMRLTGHRLEPPTEDGQAARRPLSRTPDDAQSIRLRPAEVFGAA